MGEEHTPGRRTRQYKGTEVLHGFQKQEGQSSRGLDRREEGWEVRTGRWEGPVEQTAVGNVNCVSGQRASEGFEAEGILGCGV